MAVGFFVRGNVFEILFRRIKSVLKNPAKYVENTFNGRNVKTYNNVCNVASCDREVLQVIKSCVTASKNPINRTCVS